MIGESIRDCGVIKAVTLPECTSTMGKPDGLSGPLTGKIPVVLAEPVVQVVIEACIDLPEPVFEIKRIKKNLFITQCKLIDIGKMGKGKLFLAGFVRKNIEYATPDKICKKDGISGDIKHLTVNVPFTCVTEICYFSPPHITFQPTAKQAAYSIDCEGKSICGGKTIIGRKACEDAFEAQEFFNEPVFCELKEAKFFESDIHECCYPVDSDMPWECKFQKLTEKMVILVKLKILQKQQVHIGVAEKKESFKRYS